MLKLFLNNGYEEVSVNVSHHKVRKGNKTEIIPVHGKEVPKGLFNAILKRNSVK